MPEQVDEVMFKGPKPPHNRRQYTANDGVLVDYQTRMVIVPVSEGVTHEYPFEHVELIRKRAAPKVKK